ncbi:phosphate ABC transporter substrate-binding/OmpA family protein [Yoonia maritima]|uniref:phosphate ABC transporter substrate-binding/OmpA family protein n=1 Tax=Yoonia maritima TaxID=1435347 RepID=UPI003734E356
MLTLNRCFWVAQAGFLAAMPAMAEVTLESMDRTIRVSGELIKFENDQYTIASGLGQLVIDSDKVTCSGEECPELADQLNQLIRIASNPSFTSDLLPPLMEELATQSDASLQLVVQQTTSQSGLILGEGGLLYGNFQIHSNDTSSAFDKLYNGDVEIVFSERRATNAEVERFIDAGLGNLNDSAHETIFGQDALAAVVSPDNPVKSITVAQTEAIFSGQITNWREIGGADLPIQLYVPADGGELSDYFTRAILDQNFSSFSPNVDRTLSSDELDILVSQQPGAIALLSTSDINVARPVRLASACGIIAEPDTFAIRSEDYPLSRRMYAYTTNRATPSLLRRMITILQSPKGQEIVTDAGFVSLDSETATLDGFGQQLAYSLAAPEQSGELFNMQQFTREVLNSERLSTTFRFSSGSSQIDNKARADAIRLSELLERPEYEGVEMLLIGFTDSIGKSDLNTVLSRRRATQIRDEILAASNGRINPNAITTLGFGAASPAACNSDEDGRQTNRRVEIWLR